MTKRFNRLIALFAASAAALSGCAASGAPSSAASGAGASAEQSGAPSSSALEESSKESASADAYHIGVVYISDHPSLITIRDAFQKRLTEVLDGKTIDFDMQDAQNDMSNVNSICQKFVGDKKDLIVAIATPTAQAAAAATKDIPIVYSAVTDPDAASLTGIGNVTGTSDAIPVDKIFGLAEQLTPGVKTYGFIYNTSEVNSVSVIEQAKAYLDGKGLQYVEATVTNTSEVQQSAASLVGKADAIFTPIDNTVATAMPVLSGVAVQNKLPLYVGADSMVNDGGLATVGIDYSVLGTRTAEMAADILGGKSPADIPFEVMDDFSTILNTKTAADIGIELPPEVLEGAVTFGE